MSTNTVKVHLRNIFTKIEINSRTEVAMCAVNSGFITGVSQAEEDIEAKEITSTTSQRVLPISVIGLNKIWLQFETQESLLY